MNVPWRFILALVLGFLLSLGFFVGLLYTQLGIRTGSTSARFCIDITQKKAVLAAAIPGPRLLLVGGSGTLFGLSAQTIQEQTGRPTVNLGTFAGLTWDCILHFGEKTARPGDTVLLVMEYELYTEEPATDIHDDYILSGDPDFFRQMPLIDKIGMATRVPFKRFQRGWKNARHPEPPDPPDPPYIGAATFLNDNGDETGNAVARRHPPEPAMRLPDKLLVEGLLSDRAPGFDGVRRFIEWAKSHHVTVLVAFPNIIYQPEYEQPKARQAIQVITHFYTSQGVPVIGTAREAMLPIDDFFDTVYHLTREAAVKRTERLVPELRPYLPPPP